MATYAQLSERDKMLMAQAGGKTYTPPTPTSTYNASTLSTGANPQLPALQQQLAAAQAKLVQAQGLGYTNQQLQYDANGNLIAPSAPSTPKTPVTTTPTAAQTTLETGQAESKSLLDRIKELFTQQEGKSTYQATQEQAAGITQQQKDVQDLTNQLNSISAESQAQQMTAEGQPIAMGFITGQQAQIQRTNAIKTLTTTALLSAKQGNLTLAQSQIDHAVALKYDPIESELKNKMSQLELLDKYVLTPAETARKEELDREYTQQQADLEAQKTQDSNFEKNLITAMQGGMSVAEVNQARTLYTAGNKDQANMMIAQYGGKLDTSITEINGRKVLVDNQTGTIIKDLGVATTTTDTEKTVKQDYTNQVDNYIQTGKGTGFLDKDPATGLSYINPTNWTILKRQWIENSKYTAADFNNAFSQYKDPSQSYN